MKRVESGSLFANPTFQEAQRMIDEYIHFFNYERIQLKTRQTLFNLLSVA